MWTVLIIAELAVGLVGGIRQNNLYRRLADILHAPKAQFHPIAIKESSCPP